MNMLEKPNDPNSRPRFGCDHDNLKVLASGSIHCQNCDRIWRCPGHVVLSKLEREHVEACRQHLQVGAEIRSLSGQTALLDIIDRIAPK